MNSNKKSFISSLFAILILEFIVALSINFFAYNFIVRIIGILLMILSCILYFGNAKKISINEILFLVLSLLYGVSVLPDALLNHNGLDVFSIVFSFLSVSWLGYTIGNDESYQNKPLIVIFGSLFLFGIVSLFATLFSYGFFFALTRDTSSVEHSTKMWIIGLDPFVKESRVFISFFGYELSLLSSGLMVLWANKKVESKDTLLRKIALAGGVLGVVGLLTMPYLLGIIITVVSIGITTLIIYFPKEKKKRFVIYLGGGIVALLALVVIVLKGNDIARIKAGLNVLKNVFNYPLGNQPEEVLIGTPNTRNIYLDALYQNGIPSLFVLLGITAIVGYSLVKYYKTSNDSKIKKNLILSIIIHYFIYVNLNYGQVVFVEYGDKLPLYLDPTLLVILLLTGYMIAVNNKKTAKIDLKS